MEKVKGLGPETVFLAIQSFAHIGNQRFENYVPFRSHNLILWSKPPDATQSECVLGDARHFT